VAHGGARMAAVDRGAARMARPAAAVHAVARTIHAEVLAVAVVTAAAVAAVIAAKVAVTAAAALVGLTVRAKQHLAHREKITTATTSITMPTAAMIGIIRSITMHIIAASEVKVPKSHGTRRTQIETKTKWKPPSVSQEIRGPIGRVTRPAAMIAVPAVTIGLLATTRTAITKITTRRILIRNSDLLIAFFFKRVDSPAWSNPTGDFIALLTTVSRTTCQRASAEVELRSTKDKRYTGRWHRLQSVAASAEKALSCRIADLGGNTAPCMGLA
jgi:hypothetical protein